MPIAKGADFVTSTCVAGDPGCPAHLLEALPTLETAHDFLVGSLLGQNSDKQRVLPHPGLTGTECQRPPRIPKYRLAPGAAPVSFQCGPTHSGLLEDSKPHPTLMSPDPGSGSGPDGSRQGMPRDSVSCDSPRATIHPDGQPGNWLWPRPLPSFPLLAS